MIVGDGGVGIPYGSIGCTWTANVFRITEVQVGFLVLRRVSGYLQRSCGQASGLALRAVAG